MIDEQRNSGTHELQLGAVFIVGKGFAANAHNWLNGGAIFRLDGLPG